jgi:FtsP/CotA-like multicopper oxidase with cupredoxin domain
MISTWLFVVALNAGAKTVKYDLVADRQTVNLSGRKNVDFAISLNGSIPAPTLEFTEGDDAEITVQNRMSDESLSIHWHGLLVPPLMDGVPYLTTPPIEPGGKFVFKFKLRQHGTYWYHSHTGTQEQKGVFGAIVIHPKKEAEKVDHDVVAVVSDWSDENPDQILRNLRKDGDYYLYKKGTIRSLWGALRSGFLGTYLHNEWTRMGGMDASDVGYDAFLINGRRESQLVSAKKGERVRVRVINASGSSYFTVGLGKQVLKVITADGVEIMPVSAASVVMGMAETYDFIFTLPDNLNYELRATSNDGTGFASAWIGSGTKVAAKDVPPPDLYAPMNHAAHAEHAGHHGHGDAGAELFPEKI